MKQKSDISFSIITVCLNAGQVIRATMESVLKQTWGKFEYIIVDGASTDGTVAIVREYAAKDTRIRWYSEPDSGVFNAMNKGICYANGDFILFLNAGDEFHSEDVLEKAAQMAPEADILIGDIAFKTKSGLLQHSYPAGRELLENLERGECVCHQVVFASKECLKDGFDEYYTTCADFDWICRQMKLGKKTAKLDEVVTDYDMNGITFQIRYQKIHWKEYFEVLGKYYPHPEFKYGKEVRRLFVQKKKEHFMYEFMNRWLLLKQRGVNLSTFLIRQGIHTIAIYGIHHMGQRLYDELRGSGVVVQYAIDRNTGQAMWDIPLRRPDDRLDEVEAVVVTPVFDFLEIRDSLSAKVNCPIISMEEILFYEYENGL